MSDLTATNCGCNNNSSVGSNFIWIILLLCLLGDNGCGCGNNGFGNILGGNNGNNSSCDLLVLILLISCLCGNNGGSCC